MNQVSYSVGVDDLAAANRLYFIKTISIRRWIGTFVASAVAIALTLWGFIGQIDSEIYLLALGSIWLTIIAICIFGWFMIPRQARRTWQQSQKMWVEQLVTWDAEKIHFNSARGEIHVSWGDYYRWAADNRSLLLYQDWRMFYLVPLRTFSAEAKAEIIGYLKAAGVQER